MIADPDSPRIAQLTIEAVVDDGTVRLVVAGEMDMSNADALQQCARSFLDVPATCHVVADLAGVTFIDSLGLRALVLSRRRAGELGKTFTVENDHGQVAMVIDAVGLTKLLTDPMYDPS